MELHLPPKPQPVVGPGEFQFAAVGLEHGHIYGMTNGLLEAAEDAGIPLVVNHVGGMFGIFFTEAKTVTCYQDVVKCDVERFKRFFHLMLEEGVYLAPSAFEAGFMSVAHSEEDINNTIDAARKVFAKL